MFTTEDTLELFVKIADTLNIFPFCCDVTQTFNIQSSIKANRQIRFKHLEIIHTLTQLHNWENYHNDTINYYTNIKDGYLKDKCVALTHRGLFLPAVFSVA